MTRTLINLGLATHAFLPSADHATPAVEKREAVKTRPERPTSRKVEISE